MNRRAYHLLFTKYNIKTLKKKRLKLTTKTKKQRFFLIKIITFLLAPRITACRCHAEFGGKSKFTNLYISSIFCGMLKTIFFLWNVNSQQITSQLRNMG